MSDDKLPRGLYAVTPDVADSAVLATRLTAVLAGRPALVQYRNKTADLATRLMQARLLAGLCRAAGVRFVINDSVALALEVGADGVHLGRDDGDVAEARAALGADRILGVSCYDDWSRAQAAHAAGADYVAFGAMYPSLTKPAAVRAPLALLQRACAQPMRCAAIGGITLENAPALVATGVDLLAVVSDVFDAPDPGVRVAAYGRLFLG